MKNLKWLSLCGMMMLGFSLITFTACGDDEEDNQPKTINNGGDNGGDNGQKGGINIEDLWGTWETVSVDGKAIDLSKEEDWPKWDKFEFKQDGSFNGWSINYNGDNQIRGREEQTKIGKWSYDATTKKAKLYDLIMGYHEVQAYLRGETNLTKTEISVTLVSLSAQELTLTLPGGTLLSAPSTVVMRKTSGSGDGDEEVDNDFENEASVITVEEEDTENIRFVVRNTAHNWQATIQAYDYTDRGPQIELLVEAINASKKAKITANDTQHTNFWEQAFTRYTEQATGEAMTANENVKRLTISDVKLRENQFANYYNLNEVTIIGTKDIRIPAGCFQNANLEEMNIYASANITLGKNCLPKNAYFTVFVSNKDQYVIFETYKRENGCSFAIEIYN
ncbi:MAG: hypothetical protein IJQ59_08045 [Bacteroidaceae bacterium]|nr:hypothetical protein [Bacteroidaceae bacterium]